MDNNEWGRFEEEYGLQTVNRTDGTFRRRFKRSFFDYVDFSRGIWGIRGWLWLELNRSQLSHVRIKTDTE